MTAPIRLVIVDDQGLIRTGLRMLLDAEESIDVVGEAADGATGVELVASVRPDVALMDIRMPVVNGIEATEHITRLPHVETQVLVLTTFDNDEAVIRALKAGAAGFLLKDTDPEDLIRAIQSVAAGDSVLSPQAMSRLRDALVPTENTRSSERDMAKLHPLDTTENQRASKELPDLSLLTERECEVLTLMGNGLTNAEIAEELVVAESTAKTHVSKILMKLNARDRVQAVIAAHRAGLSQ